jgi:tetratricopeptide (TPR) repeat protein
LLTGHAKLATNDNNASLLSFIAASKNPEILKQWEKWTENFLKQHQNSPIALYLAGDAKARLGKIEEAIAYFDKAIALDGNFALAYNARGVLYALKEDRNKAYFDLLQATDKDRNLADAYVNLGTLAVLQESSINLGSGALDAFGKALAINPEFALAYNNRGSLYLGNNEVEKARSDFSQVQTFPLIADLFLQNQKLADARKPSDPRDSLDGQQAPGGIISNPGESSIDRGDWKVKTCFGLFYQVSIVRETTN